VIGADTPSVSGYSGLMGESPGRIRSALQRFASSDQAIEAENLQDAAGRDGGTPIGLLPDRKVACVCGILRTVTLRPRSGVPALVAELYDGTGVLTVIWLGRRRITGIEVGRRIRVRGRVARRRERSVVFNPAYELLPAVSS
jgi:hypothetical protein